MIQMLRDYGSLRVTDASRELGVARSSAHRLLQTLVFRGFAVQDESHVYRPGPAMGVLPARLEWTRDLRRLCLPHLEVLSRRTRESANLMILVERNVRFLVTVRARTVDSTHDRDGVVLPAHEASGGKVLVAELDDASIESTFGGGAVSTAEYERLLADVRAVRSHGYAVNVEGTERGVAAVGVAIHDRWGVGVGAVSVSMRADKFAERLAEVLPLLLDCRAQIERDAADVDLASGLRSSGEPQATP